MLAPSLDPPAMLRPRRQIMGVSAVLLPFCGGAVDWVGFRGLLARTLDAGLVPAVNMDTGHVDRIDGPARLRVLAETRIVAEGREFAAGAYVADRPGDAWCRDATSRAIDEIGASGGTPVLFPSFGLNGLGDEALIAAHEFVGSRCDRFIAFELGEMFAPFGRIYSTKVYESIVKIPSCLGAKHSSLSRTLEWERLQIRDRVRPEFRVFTGNDLAIDMVMYGSDYLLGLSACAPDRFAARDAMWAAGDPEFHALNDTLQYLGQFTFRPPVPAYKHSVAMFLNLRGWIESDDPHPSSATRPESDRAILRDIAARLGVLPEG